MVDQGYRYLKIKAHGNVVEDVERVRASPDDLRESGIEEIVRPTERAYAQHVYHLYVIETEQRDEMLKYLNDAGIDAKTHYPIAIHQQEGYPWGKPADLNVSLPLTERSAARVISLPMYPELTQEEIDYVIHMVRTWEG